MKRKILLLMAGILTLTACGSKESQAPAAHAPAPAPVARGVKTAAVAAATVVDERMAVGTIKNSDVVTLSSKLMGTITSIPPEVGQRVVKGQVVATVEAKDLEAQVEKAKAGIREAEEAKGEIASADLAVQSAIKAAEANRDLASSTLERFKVLSERGSVSRQEFDEVEARYKTADAEVARAREQRNTLAAKARQIDAKKEQAQADIAALSANLAYRMVLSPVNGVVVAKPAQEGMLAAPGVPLLVIEEEGRFRLEAQAEESMLLSVKVGDRVSVTLDATGGEEHSGKVNEIGPAADPTSRTVPVKIVLDNQSGLRSGLFGRARFPGEERKVLLLPGGALVEKGQLTGVYLIDSSKTAHFTLVKVGAKRGENFELLSGLEPGALVAIGGAANLTDGARVE